MNKGEINVPQEVLDAIDIKNGPARPVGDPTWIEADKVIKAYHLEAINDLPEMQRRTTVIHDLLGVNEVSISSVPADETLSPIYGDTVKARKRDQAIYNKGERVNW